MARRPRGRVAKRRTARRPVQRAQQQSPGAASLPKRLHNLPVQLTTFIGREPEIAEIERLLASTRLLTLTGAGGAGKTRLAQRVARDLLSDFCDGVWTVDLASLSDAALVPQTVAKILDVPEQPRRNPQDTLTDALRSKGLLLLIDNCEHLLASCADLSRALLRECPDLRILATSREPLGIAGEVRWVVPPLSLPGPQEPPSAMQLKKYDATRLFVDRALAAHSKFVVSDDNADAVACVCRQLDGIPLAIEMAAAWVRVLTVQEVLQRLSDRFQLLRNGGRSASARHQTLKAAMDWSYALLSERERLLLLRLSVFSGGWSLEAAEAVCFEDGIEADTILDRLTQLVDKSLVVAETHSGKARYGLLETVRQYGRDKLGELGGLTSGQNRHLDFFLDLAERAAPHLEGTATTVWLDRLEMEHANLREALAWSMQVAPEKALRLAGALGRFWFIRGHFREGRRWLTGALERDSGGSATLRAKALYWAGEFALRQVDYAAARVLHEQSLAIYRALNDKPGTAISLNDLGTISMQEADHASACAFFEESLAIHRQLGNRQGMIDALKSLGHETWHQGDLESARRFLEEAMMLARESGQKRRDIFGVWSLALVAFDQHNHEEARSLYREGLETTRELREVWMCIFLLEGFAALMASEGHCGRAARLLGAAEANREYGGIPLPFAHRSDYDRPVATIRADLDERAFATAWSEGRAMTLDQAIDYALAQADAGQPKRERPDTAATRKRLGILAPREQAVAILVAEGNTNRQIAARLSITESTAETHVRHILNKLGFNSRAQIAAWAARRGLRLS